MLLCEAERRQALPEAQKTPAGPCAPPPSRKGCNDGGDRHLDQCGAIQPCRPGVQHRASSDGFDPAISSRKEPAKGVQIRIDENDDDKRDLRARGIAHCDGAAAPVAKGQRSMVKDDDGPPQISIAWMPVGGEDNVTAKTARRNCGACASGAFLLPLLRATARWRAGRWRDAPRRAPGRRRRPCRAA